MRLPGGSTERRSDRIAQKRDEAERAFHRVGITFAVYGEDSGTERLIPFDLVPRIIPGGRMETSSIAGLKQRVQALNAFLRDIYHDQAILKAGVVPPERVLGNSQYRREMQGSTSRAASTRTSRGVDVVRAGRGRVLRARGQPARPVRRVVHAREPQDDDAALSGAVCDAAHPSGPALPGPAAREPPWRRTGGRGAPDGRGADARVRTTRRISSTRSSRSRWASSWSRARICSSQNDTVYMRTTRGPQRVHVIYRRVDDDFLDPLAFRPDSMLGVPGLFAAYRAGRVTLANAIGTGVADDKSIYPYVPEMIRFYLSEEPILDNVPTYLLHRDEDARLRARAISPSSSSRKTHGAGGYGMLIGPTATAAEREAFRRGSSRRPTNTSRSPRSRCRPARRSSTSGLAPRHVDLRPYVLSGKTVNLVPGGLTRGRAARRLAGRQLVAGRRHEGHLGARRRSDRPDVDALPHRQRALLDGPPHRARREHRAAARRHIPDVAAALRR